jgi:FkbM family methyltransferase
MPIALVEVAEGFSIYTSGFEEAKLVYGEIYTEHCYDVAKHPPIPFFVDAGANVGLFSIYMKQKYPQSTIIAFEPAPENYDALLRNLELHKAAEGVKTYKSGLSKRKDQAMITFYPGAPANSTFYPEGKELMKVLCAEVLGQEVSDRAFGNEIEVKVPLDRLSHFLNVDYPNITAIDLLKIDVEGAELDVLSGLDEAHWAMTKNVVLEAGNRHGEVAEIQGILESKGFETITTSSNIDPADPRYKELTNYLIIGRRTAKWRE